MQLQRFPDHVQFVHVCKIPFACEISADYAATYIVIVGLQEM